MNRSNVASQAVPVPTATNGTRWSVKGWLIEVSKLFWKPTDFLKQRVDKPKIFIPYILVIVISFIFTVATADIALRERLAQSQGIDITRVAPIPFLFKLIVAAPQCIVKWLAPL